jgi:hypothetical protein
MLPCYGPPDQQLAPSKRGNPGLGRLRPPSAFDRMTGAGAQYTLAVQALDRHFTFLGAYVVCGDRTKCRCRALPGSPRRSQPAAILPVRCDWQNRRR